MPAINKILTNMTRLRNTTKQVHIEYLGKRKKDEILKDLNEDIVRIHRDLIRRVYEELR